MADTTFIVFFLFFIPAPLILVWRLVNRDTEPSRCMHLLLFFFGREFSHRFAAQVENFHFWQPIYFFQKACNVRLVLVADFTQATGPGKENLLEAKAMGCRAHRHSYQCSQ